jgi:hypothetical protein
MKPTRLGQTIGAVLGFAAGLVIAEVIFPNLGEWRFVMTGVLTALGAETGTVFTRCIRQSSKLVGPGRQ